MAARDGAEKPVISENFLKLISGRGSVPPPFAEKTARAGDCYLPIPFATGCKITFNKKSFYHIINYRGYPKGTPVRSFSHQQLQDALPLMDKTAGKLKMVLPETFSNRLETSGNLLPGKTLELTTTGKGAINSLEIRLDPEQLKQHPELLRSVVLVAAFDNVQTIWAPLGDFFGSANALNPFQTATRTVRSNGQLVCTWLMPFQKKAVLYLKNLGNTALLVAQMNCTTTDHQWNNRSMYFHANWRSDDVLPGNVFKDWNFIDIKGKGVFVGDTWTVLSADNGWWGEGDEKIYVDDAWNKKFPTHFGTGSEDYYGWAGGEAPTKDDRFSTPYLANIEVGSAISRRAGVRGFNILTRIRFLDAIPFHKSLVFDMEASPGTGARNPWDFNGYSVVTCWYALPGAKDNRPPLPEQAARPIMTLAQLDSMAAAARKKEAGIKGAIDVQQLNHALSSNNVHVVAENINTANATEWNNGNHMVLSGSSAGEWVSFILTEQFKESAIEVQVTKDQSYGTVQLYVNGQQCGKPIDLGDTGSLQPLLVSLGTYTPVNNQFLCKVQFLGSGKKKKQQFRAALDYFKVNPVQ